MAQRCLACNDVIDDEYEDYESRQQYCGGCLSSPKKLRRAQAVAAERVPPEVTAASEEAESERRLREERMATANEEREQAEALAEAHERAGNKVAAKAAREQGREAAERAKSGAVRLGPEQDTGR